eukprot:7575085-Karenia_brevis.AAC.1
MEWLLDGNILERSDAIVVGIMLREIGRNVDWDMFGWCPWLSWTYANCRWVRCWGPEYQWT